MAWTDQDSKNMINALSRPFRNKTKKSKVSIGREKSCKNPEVLFKILIPQIHETLDNNLKWETPEEWDQSFKILGGGYKRRTSSGIQSVITWEQFMDKVREIQKQKAR